LEICITVMQIGGMRIREKSTVPGITVRLPSPIRERVLKLAWFEHRSAAAYIEHLVERDLRERDEAERLVRVHVATGAAGRSFGRGHPRGRGDDCRGSKLCARTGRAAIVLRVGDRTGS
jgi:hypothetical protein